MPTPSSPKTLYRIDECLDLMADGVVGDENGNLVFISLWARDTAVQEFLARLTLGRDEQGLDQFHVITEQGASIPVFVGNVENLEKRITRDEIERTDLFLPMTASHMRALLRQQVSDELLDAHIAQVWHERQDRYSELRTENTKLPVGVQKIEMSYIGG